jgi:hypothetical protein
MFHSQVSVLAIHAKGEKVLAQSKRTAPPPISKLKSFKFVLKEGFSNGILFLIEFSNLYNPFQN